MSTESRRSPQRPTGLWGITAYYNPMRFHRRLTNYRTFHDRLAVPLVAVELAFDGEFELRADDAEILVQIRGGDVMWQKERLLNIALAALPTECTKVAWFDCDVVFVDADWPERASALVDRAALVQLFSHVHYLPRDWTNGDYRESSAEFSRRSVGWGIASGLAPEDFLDEWLEERDGTHAGGHAWAARRDLIAPHGFYDGCIIGGGTRALTCGGFGFFEGLWEPHRLNDRQKEHHLRWARPFHDTVKGSSACLDVPLFHLWHGEMRNRRTDSRHVGLAPFEFDPFSDIAVADGGGWRWNSEKPAMHRYLRDYFASRREDG